MERSMMFHAILMLSCILGLVAARPMDSKSPSEKWEKSERSLGVGVWYQPEDHFSAKLFKRQAPTDPVGSDAWQAHYPTGAPPNQTIPQAWLDALRAAEAAGLIPQIPTSVEGKYDKSISPGGTEVCSSTAQCREPTDIWDVPPGIVALSFDDGPNPASDDLLDFLKLNNQKVTHFLIGENIKANATLFLKAFGQGNDMASHTYSHRYLTSLSNVDVVAEIGWTSQIIFDLTGGRLPRYIRPPYGDSDNRVRAIIKHVFGMVQVNWNQDTDDFKLQTNEVTLEQIHANLVKWITGPKTPGLNILEHELIPGTVQAFKDFYPLIAQNGWIAKSIPEALGTPYYLNSDNNTASVTSWRVAAGTVSVPPTTSATPTMDAVTASSSSAPATTSSITPTKSSSSRTHSGRSYISYLATFACLFLIFPS